jgi:hypothetical protein
MHDALTAWFHTVGVVDSLLTVTAWMMSAAENATYDVDVWSELRHSTASTQRQQRRATHRERGETRTRCSGRSPQQEQQWNTKRGSGRKRKK